MPGFLAVTSPASIHAALRSGDATAIAIEAPGRPGLSRSGLLRQAEGIVGTLRGLGVARQDRVAMVLPNGPEMAAAFLSVAPYAAFYALTVAAIYRQWRFRP